jgi:hypothetical protein
VLSVLATLHGTAGDANGALRARLPWVLLAVSAER